MSFAALSRSEFKRLFSTYSWLILMVATVLMTLIYVISVGSTLSKPGALDVSTSHGVIELLAGGSGVALFSSLMAALLVTSEFRFGTAGLSMIESGSRNRWFLAKLPAALMAGLMFSLVCQVLALVVGLPFLWKAGVHPDLLSEGLPRAMVGSVLVGLPSALWGAFLGLLIRSQVGTVLGLVAYTAMIEGAILVPRLPGLGKWLPGGAQAAIVADPTLPYDNTALGIGVFAVWIAAVGAAALVRLRRADVDV